LNPMVFTTRKTGFSLLSLVSKYPLAILVCITFAINANTLSNKYAADDAVVLTGNRFVQNGIKGIPEIVSNDYFGGVNGVDKNELAGGRYRPLTLIIFSLEYQFFGANPVISHFINVLLFALLIGLLFKLLNVYIFDRKQQQAAFVTCLLFILHPVHTEVVANVKGRDEILTFIFVILSLIAFIRYVEKEKSTALVISLIFFLLALLIKETSVTFIGVLPLVMYFFFHRSVKKSIRSSLPFVAVFAGYSLLRLMVVGFDLSSSKLILNSPFLYATPHEAFATKVYVVFKYLLLLLFPHPLTSDYSYNVVPYVDVSSVRFIVAVIALLVLMAFALSAFKKKSVYAFCILFYFVTISIFSNFFIGVGTPMAERFLFQPSLAFCLIIGSVYSRYEKKGRLIIRLAMMVVVFLFAIKTFMRNREWKDNETLYFSDIKTSPNSLRLNQFATEYYYFKAQNEMDDDVKNEYLKKAVDYGEKSLKIDSGNPVAYVELGHANASLHLYRKAADYWIKAYQLNPAYPDLKKWMDDLSKRLYVEGNGLSDQGKTDEAIKCYLKSVELDKNQIEAWYNLGGIYYFKNDTAAATEAWRKVMAMDPHHRFDKKEFEKY
jgi:tetratricopeptide (TPR) repeat protein